MLVNYVTISEISGKKACRNHILWPCHTRDIIVSVWFIHNLLERWYSPSVFLGELGGRLKQLLYGQRRIYIFILLLPMAVKQSWVKRGSRVMITVQLRRKTWSLLFTQSFSMSSSMGRLILWLDFQVSWNHSCHVITKGMSFANHNMMTESRGPKTPGGWRRVKSLCFWFFFFFHCSYKQNKDQLSCPWFWLKCR